MSQLEHWNPVALSSALGNKPLGVKVSGREIVLFRSADGTAGAIDDVCVHRRMRLSCGTVERGCLVCPYHGWKFHADGYAESPGTPRMRGRAESYDVREAQGLLWVKPRECTAEFPHFKEDDFHALGAMHHVAEAPLEVALDNFSEVEHTPMTHKLFGYDLHRMAEVTCDVTTTETSVHCRTAGPHKPIDAWIRRVMGVGKNVEFFDEWDTYYSPVHMIIDHSLRDADTKMPGRIQYRVHVFFTEVDEKQTNIFTVLHVKSRFPGPKQGMRIIGPWVKRFASDEIEYDCQMLKRLADNSSDLAGMKLSRFDKLLQINRERIRRIYRGIDLPPMRANLMGGAITPIRQDHVH